MSPKRQKNGVSLRRIQIWLVVGAVLLSGLMVYSTYRLTASYRNLVNTSEQHIELRKAARELMDASDYLTEKVQRFAVSGEILHMQAYFDEMIHMQRREEAIETINGNTENTAAIEKLHDALEISNTLVKREYYAMRLVIEAKEETDIPPMLQKVTLSAEDQALSSEEKMQRAAEIVFDDEYYALKERIRKDMREGLDELEKQADNRNSSTLASLRERMLLVRIVIILQTVVVFFLVWLTSRLGIHPILGAVERIKEDSKLPEAGAREFRYLVRAYNKMFENYKKSLDRLHFKASHDALTGVYNRDGYHSLLKEIDLNRTYMLLVDVDSFKEINDTYGHEVGDRVLVKLVQALKQYFRREDFICRIGGDEFVVLMQNAPPEQQEMLAGKINAINAFLRKTDDGLPAASISVGITHGSAAATAEELFEKTDAAMYQAKQNGKQTYTFGA